VNLSARSALPELMDNADVPDDVYQRCLKNLAQINRITFTHRATLAWLDAVTKHLAPGSAISILDVAFGQGDLLRAIAAWARRRNFRATLTGIDLNPRSAIAARAATPAGDNIGYFSGDVFSYQPVPKPDYIVTSQFTHHLPDDDVVRLLRWLETNAARGFAYYGFPLLARIMFWHRIVRHDGAVSIARGFTRGEWQNLLRRAGISAEISWHLPFRYGIGRIR
jgi:SAM-dependent methyltransferase